MGEETTRRARREELDELEMIASLAKLIDPEKTCAEVLRLTTKWFDADGGQIVLVDMTTGKPEIKATSNALSESDLDFSSTILTDAVRGGKPLCVLDAKLHPSYGNADSVRDVPAPTLSVIVVPLRDAWGHVSGALYLQRRCSSKGLYDSSFDVTRLSRMIDALSPILLSQQQDQFFSSMRLSHTKSIIVEMGFIVGPSKLMESQVYDRIEKFAHSDHTVCIQGETGTGKELVAQAIHRLSPRASKPFVRVPCNAIPEGLAESELFGHVRGAFAQAYNDKPSPFERADGGTIFLDEIGSLPIAIQAKLLHVLEKGTSAYVEFNRVGGSKDVRADVRVLAASNRDLRTMVHAREFREDLFYRLNQLELLVPPLRERRDDIIPLAVGFLDRCEKGHRRHGLAEEATQVLLDYHWPGNVRELKASIEQGALLHEGDGPLNANEIVRDPSRAELLAEENLAEDLGGIPFKDLSKKQKQQVIRAAVSRLGSPRKAARELGISHQTVYNHLEQD
jgi:transcriptional regulator with GAF, ATPase, and Fis domain